MKKQIRVVNKETGIVQITTPDERWYVKEKKDKKTGLPSYEYVPSVTWIAGKYPKGVEFYKWLAGKGWDESQSVKQSAGEKGDKVHRAITEMLEGETIKLDGTLHNKETGQDDDITVEEYDCLMAFQSWFNEVKPEVLFNEVVVWGNGYAGTVDLICKIGGEYWIVDFKTGQYVWPEYELQLSAYKKAVADEYIKDPKLAILQIGYKRNKKGYKFTEIEDKYELFKAAQMIWANEHSSDKPGQKDYPLEIKLDLPVKEDEKDEKKPVKKRK